MKFAEAFRETMFRYNLQGKDLAIKSGLTETQISRFRNGDNLRIDSIERLLEVMPADAREYMLLLVLHDREAGHVPLPAIKNPPIADDDSDDG